MNKNQSGMYVVLALIAVLFISSVIVSGPNTSQSEISYSDFLHKLDNGEFSKIEKADEYLIAVPKDQPKQDNVQKESDKLLSPFLTEKKVPQKQYKVFTPKDETLMSKLEKANVDLSVKKQSESMQLGALLGGTLLPFILLFGVLFMLSKSIQAGGTQAMSFGKSKALATTDSVVIL